MSDILGPNVKKLIAHKMSLLAIPPGSGKNSFTLGVEALTNPGKFSSLASQASDWVRQALTAIKSAPHNPYGNNDEAIAAALLERIEERRQDSSE